VPASEPSTDVDRSPLDPGLVRARLAAAGLADRYDVRQVLRTGSTNADLAAQAPDDPAVTVLTTEEQVAGRGRAGRVWSCPAGAGLMFSVRLTVDGALAGVPADRYGWSGAVLALAIRQALAGLLPVDLKWPNDLLVADRKLGGILAEFTGSAVVVGAGVNVALTTAELPRADATSLALQGISVDRAELLADVLIALDGLLAGWRTDPDGIRDRYRPACGTLGRQVRLELPGDRTVTGTALDVAPDGGLVVRTPDGTRTFGAGDVVHLRAAVGHTP
jgi:BirA family transcriptional regulator, biotin operon repressor / biotin---[acetyl-CoA-carboxylase] ligase